MLHQNDWIMKLFCTFASGYFNLISYGEQRKHNIWLYVGESSQQIWLLSRNVKNNKG